MAKPGKKNRQDPAELAKDVLAKLKAGRSMSALKQAKLLVKQQEDATSLELLSAAYVARIDDLHAAGMVAEAEQVLAVARERFPELGEQWSAAEQGVAQAKGDLSQPLGRWVAEPGAREELTVLLRGTVRDPRWIADSEVLPADDPLRLAAQGVQTAFEQAARGRLDDAGRAALRSVGRKSPLVPWRHFVLALDAFHDHDDDRCRELLASIADGDATAPARDVLLAALLDTLPPTTTVGRRATQRMVGAAPAAWAHAQRCAASRYDSPEFGEAATATLRELKQVGKRPVLRFVRMLTLGGSLDETARWAIPAGVMPGWLGEDMGRLIALTTDDPVEAVASWSMWLVRRIERQRQPRPVEMALTLDNIAPPLAMLREELEDVLDVDVFERWERGEPTAAILRSFMERYELTPTDKILFAAWESWRKLFELIEQHTGVQRSGGFTLAEIHRQLVLLDPTPRRFARFADVAEQFDADDLDTVLEQWCDAFPQDVEPWLRRTSRAEESGALAKANRHLARAEKLSPTDPRVRRMRTRIALGALDRHWRQRKPELCLKDLGELEKLPFARTADGKLFLLALQARIQSLDTAQLRELFGDDPDSARLRSLRSLADHVLRGGPVHVHGADRSEKLAHSAWLAHLAEQLGRPLRKLPDGVGGLAKLHADELPEADDALLALCELGASAREPRLRSVAAGKGFRRDSNRLARFLAHRALSLPRNYRERSRMCAELAAFHATRFGDAETQRMLADAGFQPDETMTEAQARVGVETERGLSDWTTSGGKAPAKRRRSGTERKPNAARQLGLFDDAEGPEQQEETT